MTPSEAMAASNLASSATMAGLLRCLVQNRLLQPADIREIYETALLLLEQQQAAVPHAEASFCAARAVIERQL
ncbi:MAG TPA: hypothetical protein VGN82_08830 [Bosea sp. (in: a-proteobacteria)]|jgi:hypothetical protein|uniref:hypothetical protein n=1 Tax=Bosea sp. (in: a-proteobacteria) TaxID=1871050 RepID=UPI002E0D4232|nr:hypothetical protein [Bosea sp. (in: a-proteobacteria)]